MAIGQGNPIFSRRFICRFGDTIAESMYIDLCEIKKRSGSNNAGYSNSKLLRSLTRIPVIKAEFTKFQATYLLLLLNRTQ